MNTKTENVTITQERYMQLMKAELMLQCLESGGVDDWQWHDEAVIDYYKQAVEKGWEEPD